MSASSDQQQPEHRVTDAARDAHPHAEDVRLAREALAGSPAARLRFGERMRCVPRFLTAIEARRGRTLSGHDLEDVVQETLTQIWRRLDSYQGLASLQTWAYRFCQHTLSTHRRTRRRRSELAGAAQLGAEESERAQADFAWVHEALERVREPDAEVVRLRYFEHLRFAEIARRLGLAESTVKALHRRGLERLRELLRGERGDERA